MTSIPTILVDGVPRKQTTAADPSQKSTNDEVAVRKLTDESPRKMTTDSSHYPKRLFSLSDHRPSMDLGHLTGDKMARMAALEQYLARKQSMASFVPSEFVQEDLEQVQSQRNLLTKLRLRKAKGCAWFFWYLNFLFKYTGLKHLALLLLLAAYALLGGAIFQALEYPNEVKAQWEVEQAVKHNVEEFTDYLTNLTDDTSLQSNIRDRLKVFYIRMVTDEGLNSIAVSHDKNTTIWTLNHATFYAMTLFTTIGYGTISCQTAWGQAASVLYSFIGIPLMLCVLGDTGRCLYVLLQQFYNYLRSKRKRTDSTSRTNVGEESAEGEEEDAVEDNVVSFPLWLAVTLFFVHCLLCSIFVYTFDIIEGDYEGMSFGHAFYFCYISLTTIGLGDIMPNNIHYSPFVVLLFFLGLVLLSVMNSASYGQMESNYFRAMSALEEVLHELETDQRSKVHNNVSNDSKRLVCTSETLTSQSSQEMRKKRKLYVELSTVARMATLSEGDDSHSQVGGGSLADSRSSLRELPHPPTLPELCRFGWHNLRASFRNKYNQNIILAPVAKRFSSDSALNLFNGKSDAEEQGTWNKDKSCPDIFRVHDNKCFHHDVQDETGPDMLQQEKKCPHNVQDRKCPDNIGDGKCPNNVQDRKCQDHVQDKKCPDNIGDGKCPDNIGDGKCPDNVKDCSDKKVPGKLHADVFYMEDES